MWIYSLSVPSNLTKVVKSLHCLMLGGNSLNKFAYVSWKVPFARGVTSLIVLLDLRHLAFCTISKER